MDAAQRAALDRYFAAMQSGGARVLSNATQARKILAAEPVEVTAGTAEVEPEPVGAAPVAPSPLSFPTASLYPVP